MEVTSEKLNFYISRYLIYSIKVTNLNKKNQDLIENHKGNIKVYESN